MYRLLLIAALCCLSLLARAQSPGPYALKDGAFRENNVVMRLQAGQATRLESPLAFADGSVLSPNGTLTRKDGTRQVLPNGQAVNPQGVVVNLRDDMQSAQAIEQRNRSVAGGRGESTVNLPGSTVSTATAQQLRQLEQRVSLLQQLTDRLADRTAQAVGNNPGAAPIDAQIQALEAQ